MKEVYGAVIGYGNMAKTFLLRRHESVGVVDILSNQRAAAEKKGLQSFSSLQELAARKNPGFVGIFTPTAQHFKNISEAMAMGVPIFVEKPVVRTNAEAAMLREQAKTYTKPIFVGEVELFNPDLAPFTNYKGKPRHINIRRDVDLKFFLGEDFGAKPDPKPWFLNEAMSGGIVLDLMVHDITMLMAKYGPMYGKPVIESVSATKLDRAFGIYDNVTACLRFGDFTATLEGSWTAKRQDRKDSPIKTTIDVLGGRRKDNLHVVCDTYGIREAGDPEDAFNREYTAFFDAVKTGRTPYSLETFLSAVEVANDITAKIHEEE